MKELDWVEGQNLQLVVRWAAGQPARLRELASELVASGVEA
jgi:hypothetical protein